MTRTKLQLARDRVRLQNQIECLLEEMRIKLSIVVSNLLGASGLRILHALAKGETDPKKLAHQAVEFGHLLIDQLQSLSLQGQRLPMHGLHPSRQSIDQWLLRALQPLISQAAHAAVAKKGSHFQAVFRRLLPRLLGYQSAVWAVAHRLCRLVWKILHEGVRFIEQGCEPDPRAKKKRAQMLARALRKLGYEVTIAPINQIAGRAAVQA